MEGGQCRSFAFKVFALQLDDLYILIIIDIHSVQLELWSVKYLLYKG